MNDKNVLEIIKEMTKKIKDTTNGLVAITEKRYQYSKDECEVIFNNIYGAVEEYVNKDKNEDSYEKLLIALSDRFKVSPTGGNISRQIDELSTADFLFANQSRFQELLDNAKDIVVFIEGKADTIPGTSIKKISGEKDLADVYDQQQAEQNTDQEQTPEETEQVPPAE